MTNDNSTNGLLKPLEKLRFQEIMGKILSQRPPLSNLSNAEKQDLLYLLNKLGIIVDIVEDTRSNTQRIQGEHLLISRVIYITAFIAIFLVVVTIPAMIATAITGSQFLGALIVVGLTLILILGTGALLGKISWGMFLLTTIASIAFFILLRLLA